MLAKLRPDMDDDAALSAFQLYAALKDRARLRRIKALRAQERPRESR